MSNEEWMNRWRALMLFHYGKYYDDSVISAKWLRQQRNRWITPSAAADYWARLWNMPKLTNR